MKELCYPFDSRFILKYRKRLKKELLADGSSRITKKIAVLGGSTSNDIICALELFLLNCGIEPIFYLSEYNKFWEDAVFGNEELDSFSPDIIYIHTTSRNITMFADDFAETPNQIEERILSQFTHFKTMWIKLSERFSCPIIQNNFELPLCRQLGNSDCWSNYGKSNFINRLNQLMAEYARNNNGFYINDINYLSSCIGLEKWHSIKDWCMYKYAMSLDVIPELSYSIASIIKSIYGKNKKVIALDLDNTLWSGVIGDDGQEGIEIGQETPVAQIFSEFQQYIKQYKQMGVLLTVCSKNDEENALLGLNHPESILHPSDFVKIKANWNSKDRNIEDLSNELSLLTESFVFVDDNPAECNIVKSQLPEVEVIGFENVGEAMYKLSRNAFFEVTSLSSDDIKRNEMYIANAKRAEQQKSFESYTDYLKSLEMEAVIEDFRPIYIKRIAQLTNKSNQFNLTTKRYSDSDMDLVFKSNEYIRLYGKLEDKFGDNGIVSVIIGKCCEDILHIDLWLMSCRVLKRDMELAMLDELVECCKKRNISQIIGYYYKTPKNSMVSSLYDSFGFTLLEKSENGDSKWCLDVNAYVKKNNVIKIKESELTNNG